MVRLGDIGTVITGNTPKTSDSQNYAANDICFVKPSDIAGGTVTYLDDTEFYISEYARTKARILPPQSVLVTCIGIIGKVAINNVECAFNQQINAIIPDKRKCLTEYLAYAIQNKQAQMQDAANAPVVPILNKTQFSDIEIKLPTLSEQAKVVENMNTVSKLIALRKEQLAKLDQLVKARFVEMFGVPGNDDFGWGMVPLGSVCYINPKKSQDPRLSGGVEVSFVPMSAVTERGEIDTTTVKKYDEVKTGFTYFAENDVLFAKITPCMENGKGAVARGLCNGIGFGSTEFHVLRPIKGQTNPYWIYMLTVFSQFREDAANNMTGSAGQRRVPASFLENYRVAVPPIELQEHFSAFVEQTDKSKLTIQQSLDKLEVMKKDLMQEYFG